MSSVTFAVATSQTSDEFTGSDEDEWDSSIWDVVNTATTAISGNTGQINARVETNACASDTAVNINGFNDVNFVIKLKGYNTASDHSWFFGSRPNFLSIDTNWADAVGFEIKPDNQKVAFIIGDGQIICEDYPEATPPIQGADFDYNTLTVSFHREANNDYYIQWLIDDVNRCDTNNYTTLLNRKAYIRRYGGDQNIFFDDMNVLTEGAVAGNAVPDANITQIDSNSDQLPLEVTQAVDGNLTIGFYAFDSDGEDLNANLWYDTSQGGKTNELVRDLNLTSDICLSDTNGDSRTFCELDWDILGLADNNYFVTLELNDGTDTDTNSTEFSTGIRVFGDATPDANITLIDGSNDQIPLVFSNVVDGNLTVGFYVSDADGDDLNANLWHGLSQGTKTTEIFRDLNLSSDICLTDINSSERTFCSYDWSIAGLSDGNYFVSLEINDGDNTDTNNSEFELGINIDNTIPTISSDINAGWNLLGDANVHLTCLDSNSGANETLYRVDDDNTSANNWGAWTVYDSNVLITNAEYGDGNFGFAYKCNDFAGNDSNSDFNGTIENVLLEVGLPTTPTGIVPQLDGFVTSATVACEVPNWIRDVNYVMDFNTGTEDFNQFYVGTDSSFDFDLSWIADDTNVWFRCKITDDDKNGATLTSTSPIVINPDTGFTSISNPSPSDPTTVFGTNLTFTVDASDTSGVKACSFEIYENAVKVDDVNGTPPNSDNNNGTWILNYTSGIENGDLFFSYVSCVDTLGNYSSKIATSTYSVSISAPTEVVTGGGGGSPEVPDFATPSLITIQPSTRTLNLPEGSVRIYTILVENLTDSDLPFEANLRDGLEDFLTPQFEDTSIAPRDFLLLSWEARADSNYEFFTGFVEFNLNNGQEKVKQELSLSPTAGFSLSEILNIKIGEVPIILIIFGALVFFVVIRGDKRLKFLK